MKLGQLKANRCRWKIWGYVLSILDSGIPSTSSRIQLLPETQKRTAKSEHSIFKNIIPRGEMKAMKFAFISTVNIEQDNYLYWKVKQEFLYFCVMTMA